MNMDKITHNIEEYREEKSIYLVKLFTKNPTKVVIAVGLSRTGVFILR